MCGDCIFKDPTKTASIPIEDIEKQQAAARAQRETRKTSIIVEEDDDDVNNTGDIDGDEVIY